MIPIPRTLGLTPEQVDDLLTTADRAPSRHDNRPWRFHVTSRVIELYSVPERALPVADPDGREQRMACGAALFNLRLALHGHHVRPTVTFFPDRSRPGLLAVIRHGGTREPTPEQTRLLLAIPAQRFDRRPSGATAVPRNEQHGLRRAALDEGAWLHVVHDRPERALLRTLVLRAERLQTADPAFRAELATWSARSGGVPDCLPAGADGQESIEEEPLMALLTSHLTGTVAEIQVGQALQRVLLTATAAGLATTLLRQVVEVPHTREELRRLFSAARPPQAVLRIGWPGAGTPRHGGDVMTTATVP
ncbi:nitroreductase family protein [Pseudonocardia charpentierae]|uniref:Nitroreductase family protein n=1 Tax=Pseudonocardia charpentierae TaxID=3075545 RepID=A0ABU2NFX0_9PSEU|nr:nitroreductase family protein [Pseudonocardia sp. DSM 45834]MDT0352856.1 nitroreductase family protein [Pseudonocardia sp. DSM 45834]